MRRDLGAWLKQLGHGDAWELVMARPGKSLFEIANEGDVVPVAITQGLLVYASSSRRVVEVLRELLARELIAERRNRRLAYTMAAGGLRHPWSDLIAGVAREAARMPDEWRPTSGLDPDLVELFETALNGLTEDQRAAIAEGRTETQPGDALDEALSTIWRAVSIYDGLDTYLQQCAPFPADLVALFATRWCETEVCNGGFDQFFLNPTGIVAPDAVAGFRIIGQLKCASVVERAIAAFGGSYPRERFERQQAMERCGAGRWDDLDTEFYALLRHEAGGYLARADAAAVRLGYTGATRTRYSR